MLLILYLKECTTVTDDWKVLNFVKQKNLFKKGLPSWFASAGTAHFIIDINKQLLHIWEQRKVDVKYWKPHLSTYITEGGRQSIQNIEHTFFIFRDLR